jgi:hypothetical protein
MWVWVPVRVCGSGSGFGYVGLGPGSGRRGSGSGFGYMWIWVRVRACVASFGKPMAMVAKYDLVPSWNKVSGHIPAASSRRAGPCSCVKLSRTDLNPSPPPAFELRVPRNVDVELPRGQNVKGGTYQ